MEPRRPRRHGFAGAPNCYQVVSWAVSLASCSLFYSLLLPNCPKRIFQFALSGFSTCFFTSLLSYLKCALTDPSDRGLLDQLDCATPPNAFTRFCLICKAHVQSSSKHCRICNRCTEDFDHHCVWINTCIGGKNYKWFIGLIINLEGTMLVEIATAGFLLFEVFMDGVWDSNIVKRYDFGEFGICFLLAVFFMAAMSFFLSISIGFLIAFHGMLFMKRLSTFQYLARKQMRSAKVSAIKYTAPDIRDSVIEAQEHSSVLQESNGEGPLQLAYDPHANPSKSAISLRKNTK